MRIETHSHTCHSLDSLSLVEDIVDYCVKRNVDAIIINDHDNCELDADERALFSDKNITVLTAIEFTTQEGVHVIGIGDAIDKLQAKMYHYSSVEIVKLLIENSYYVLLPHPSHATGVLGNHKISKEGQGFLIKNSHFIEKDNFRYGPSKSEHLSQIDEINPKIQCLIGSDAHSAKDTGAYLNEIDCSSENTSEIMTLLYEGEIAHIYNMRRSRGYFAWRRVKKSKVYQAIINILTPDTRRKIKNFLHLE